MLFKCPTFLYFMLFAGAFVSQTNCHYIRFTFDRLVHSVKNEISSPNNPENNSATPEQGTLDFFGRDLIREGTKVVKSVSSVARGVKSFFSKTTSGLDCDKSLAKGGANEFKSKIAAIYPGTKWCGDGNISKYYDDLGKHSSTDACCREHDLCPDNIAADAEKYNLLNNGLFTRSHCDCDSAFYDCLKKADSGVATRIGYTYFNILGPQCFREDYPVTGCSTKEREKCVRYEKDRTGSRIFQWFDSPAF